MASMVRTRAVEPVDPGYDHRYAVPELEREAISMAPLQHVVYFLLDVERELIHQPHRVEEPIRADSLAEELGQLIEQLYVPLDLLGRGWPLNLDHDALAPRQHCSMHLSYGGSSNRLGVEPLEQPIQSKSELGFHHLPHHVDGDRRDTVLEFHQFLDDVGRDHVGPSTEKLPELHERRPQFLQHLADVLTALLRHGLGPTAARGDKLPEVVTLEEVAEAVPDRHLGDLPDPIEVAETGNEPDGMDGRHNAAPGPGGAARGPEGCRRRRPAAARPG